MRGTWLDATDDERSAEDPFLSDPSLSGEDDEEVERRGRSLLTKSPGGGNDFLCKYCQQNVGYTGTANVLTQTKNGMQYAIHV